MTENKKYIGCKFWLCKQCKNYQKFLTISSMQDICRNRGCFYESDDETNHPLNPERVKAVTESTK
jgi:hypothetical protein